jgi:RNA polymerase sigma-70 factor (ECF subfamily)
METTSVSLLERLRLPGQAQAWNRFVELYSPLLLYWARKAGLRPEDAADMVQDIFSVLVQKLPEFSYDKTKRFRGWLRTISLNKLRDRLRKRAGEPDSLKDADLSALEGTNGLEDFWDVEHHRCLVKRALEIMQAEFQSTTWKACWEHIVNGRSGVEVAEDLGISENAVYIAKYRVLRRLRTEFEGLLD